MQEKKSKSANKIPVLPFAMLSVLLAAVIGVLAFVWLRFGTSLSQEEVPRTMDTYAMDAVVQQTVYGENAQNALSEASKAVNELDALLSWRREDSDIAKVNHAGGNTPVQVDPRTMQVLQTALEVAQQTNGAFDPTILPVSSLWDFDSELHEVPALETIQSFLPNIGYQNLSLDPAANTVTLAHADNAIDLGSIGKGAGCDVAIEAYQRTGAGYGIVAVGGSIGVYGQRPSGKPWVVSIQNPDVKEGDTAVLGSISLPSGFVSTSGTYMKTFEQDGVVYHHILDPKTGLPVQSDLVSVTVACQSGALSDALSTACLSLGIEKSLPLLEHYGASAVFVDRNHQVTVTGALKDSFTLSAKGFSLT